MKITRVSVWHVPLTSHETYYMADGKTCDTVETVVLRVDTDEGVSGWGEVCPIPHYLPAYARGVAPALTELAPVLIGANPVGVEAVMAQAEAFLPDHRYAKSALDIADRQRCTGARHDTVSGETRRVWRLARGCRASDPSA